MSINVEKRVPFGFKGEWGNVYKLYTSDAVSNNILQYQESYYYDIGVDVQFKYLNKGVDKYTNNSQPVQNLIAKGEYRTIETTDAMFDEFTNRYECVVSPNDIIKVFGCYWVCEEIEEHSVFTPAKQTFYYLKCKRIFNQSLEDLNVMGATVIDVNYTHDNESKVSSYKMYNENQDIKIIWADGKEEIIPAEKKDITISHTYNKPIKGKEIILSRSEYEFLGGINLETPKDGLTAISFSKDVKKIGSGDDFSEYHLLENINIDVKNPYYLSHGNCVVDKTDNSLMFGAINCKIPGFVTKIMPRALFGRKQNEIIIPDGVTSLFGIPFYNTRPNKITISKNSKLKTIEWGAFFGLGVPIDKINIPKYVTKIDEAAFTDAIINEMWFYTDIVPFIGVGAMPDANDVTTIYVKETLVDEFKSVLGDAYAEKIKGW